MEFMWDWVGSNYGDTISLNEFSLTIIMNLLFGCEYLVIQAEHI